MADVTSHPAGAFAWAELATSDQQAAVAFYRALFGWDVSDQPIGGGETYSMFTLRGREVAAAYAMRDDERNMGIPPHWNMYVAVANADEAVARAASLGARTLAPPFDVMDVGRMAVLQDPAGAVFQVWQAKAHVGARVVNEPGALCWTELTTRDTKTAEQFYTQLFGWRPKHSAPGSPMEYTEFSVGDQPSIGMMAMPPQMPPHVPSFWMPYFMVADCDAATRQAAERGATVLVGPDNIADAGRFAVLRDPQGAVVAVFTPKA